MANPLLRRIASLEHEYGRRLEHRDVARIRELTELLMSDEVARDLAEECTMDFITTGRCGKPCHQMLEERVEMLRGAVLEQAATGGISRPPAGSSAIGDV